MDEVKNYTPDKKEFAIYIQKAYERKNKKKYMNNINKKILFLEVSGTFFNIFLMENFITKSMQKRINNYYDYGLKKGIDSPEGVNYVDKFIKYMKRQIINISINKFYEVAIRTYPSQNKETVYFLGAGKLIDDVIFSKSKGFKVK